MKNHSNSLKNSKVIVKDEGTLHEIVKLVKDEKKKEKEKKKADTSLKK